MMRCFFFKFIFLYFILIFCFNCEACKINDPMELFNRKFYSLNKELDKFILKPVTITYLNRMPKFVIKHVGYIIQNYNEFSNIAHSLFQLNRCNVVNNCVRYIINSLFGCFGVFDFSINFKFLFNKEHYGKTLNFLGYNKSVYLVLPILGSCTIRDIFSLLINNDLIVNKFYLDSYIKYYYIFYILYERIFLLSSEKIFLEASVDEYILSKNIYLQYIYYKFNN